MKVCHFITRLIVGGAQENTFLSARGLVEAGHECVLLTGPSEGREGQLLGKMKNPGIEIVESPLFVREISPLTDLRALFYLRDFLRERKFDVLHTHSSKAGILGRVAGRMAGVPMVVHTIHGLAFGPYESPPEQYKVVYSGMELDRFLEAERDDALRRSLGIPDHCRVVGVIARLFPRKGYEDFFPVAANIARELPDTHFLILGDGPKRYEYEAWTESLGIRSRVTFAGLVPPDEVPRYIAQMDVAAHFSLKEGLPRVAVQALAEGKPVVAYHLDGTPEVVISGKTGFTVPARDLQAATDMLLRLLKSPEEASEMGARGRELVREKFPWRKMSDTLIREYESFLGEKCSA